MNEQKFALKVTKYGLRFTTNDKVVHEVRALTGYLRDKSDDGIPYDDLMSVYLSQSNGFFLDENNIVYPLTSVFSIEWFVAEKRDLYCNENKMSFFGCKTFISESSARELFFK